MPLRVCLIGAGVIGLSTAITLLEQGHRVEILTETLSPNTTSDWSGARIKPTEHTEPEDRVRQWTNVSLKKFLDLLETEVGTSITPAWSKEYYTAPQPEPSWKNSVQSFRRFNPSELAETPGVVDGWTFKSAVVYPTVFLNWLYKKFLNLGGTIQIFKVNSFQEISKDKYDIIVNCAGLGARALVGDREVFPIKGQLVICWAPWITDCYYYVKDGFESEPAYIIPRGDGSVVVGGTRDYHNWDRTIDFQIAKTILNRCSSLWPHLLSGAEILGHSIGLRPYRKEIRLELELNNPNSSLPIIHNYGHGGSGVTLCWGCAEEVSQILRTNNLTRSRL